MRQHEITGSAVGSAQALPLDEQIAVVRAAGGIKPHHGWGNQPLTVRFSARDDEAAENIGRVLDKANNPMGVLGGGGGLLRAYGLHWPGYRK